MPKYAPENGGIPKLSTYLGGTTVACGTASTAITVPAGATTAFLSAEGGVLYWTVNGSAAGTTSPGYAAQNATGIVYTIDNLNTLHVAGAAATIAHVEFYQD